MEPSIEQPTVLDKTDQDGKRLTLSRRKVLGGIAAAGAGAAATIVAGCETSDNGSSGGDNGSSAGNDGPPSYGTGINEGFDGKIELDVRDSKADWTPF